LLAQNAVILQEAILKASQIEATDVGTNRKRFDLAFESELRDVSADARREAVRSLRNATDIALRRDDREAVMQASNLQEAVERMANMRIQRLNIGADTRQKNAEILRIRENVRQMQLDGTLKKLNIALRRQGIMPHDPMYARVGARLIPDLIDKGKSALDDFWNFFKR